jgi:hypothetical protein
MAEQVQAERNHADKIPSAKAAYMELRGAKKDGGCSKVEVAGGVSKELGCCNYFQPATEDTKRFDCGNCEYLIKIKENK